MAEEDDKRSSEANITIGTHVGSALAQAGLILASQLIPGAEALAAITTIIGPAANMIGLAVKEREAKRFVKLTQGIHQAEPDKDPAAIAKDIADKQSEEWVRTAFYDSYQRALTAIDEEVVPYMGVLLGRHMQGKLQLGRWFFRAFGRVLADIDGEDLKALRDMLRGTVTSGASDVEVEAGKGVADVRNALRLVSLLKREELAFEPPVGFGGGPRPGRAVMNANYSAAMLDIIADERVTLVVP
jgi:hypothetical protein